MRVTNEVVEMMDECARDALANGLPGVYECAHHLLTLTTAFKVMMTDVATILESLPIEGYVAYEGPEVPDAS